MKMFFVFILTFFCITSCYANGYANIDSHPLTSANEPAFTLVEQQLSKAKTLSGDFTQIRKMKLLSAPLISKGHFVLSKSQGLQWVQTTPFQSTLIVTANKIEQRIENTPPTIMTREEQPIVFSFTSIFLSIFNGDSKSIQSYFKIYFSGNINKWDIELKPIDPLLQKAITSIEMSGGKYIHAITINETKQNLMTMRFSNIVENR